MKKSEEYYNIIKKMTKAFSGDEFYQNFLSYQEMGKNSVEVYRSKKNKTIDKSWVNFIEGSIISLDNIVRNPRKFIAREEEIVPIELSKSITTESVKHLAQHTNLISEVTEDHITPNKILNINKEESFEIYENRFIYTLLLKLKDFVDKRMDLIANSMVDNDVINVGVKSNFNYEGRVINYHLQLDTKANSDDINTENKEEVEIFERVTKISKIINEFCASPFSQKMRKYALVKPPITRTNVILKNPDFKKALTLWQFIETYDKVGFDVDNVESLEDVSKEELPVLQNNVFLDMILYQNILSLNESAPKVKKVTKFSPKFIKKFLELVVENSDVEDIEFKKIFYDAYNKQRESIDESQKEKYEKAIDDALLEDENYLERCEIRIEKEELERQLELERQRREREAEKERIRLEKEAEKERIRLEKQKKIDEEKARKAEETRIKAEEKARKAEERAKIRAEKEEIRRKKEEEKNRLVRIKEEQEEAIKRALREAREKEDAIYREEEEQRLAKLREEGMEGYRILEEARKAKLQHEENKIKALKETIEKHLDLDRNGNFTSNISRLSKTAQESEKSRLINALLDMQMSKPKSESYTTSVVNDSNNTDVQPEVVDDSDNISDETKERKNKLTIDLQGKTYNEIQALALKMLKEREQQMKDNVIENFNLNKDEENSSN